MPKQTYSYGKTDLFICQNRPIYSIYCKTDLLPLSPPLLWEDMTKDSLYHKTDLFMLFIRQNRTIHMAKQTYSYGKTELIIWKKRPVYMGKQTYLYGKIWRKRPIYMAKETYVYGKRDPRMWHKRPAYVANTYVTSSCTYVTSSYTYGIRDLRMWQKRPTWHASAVGVSRRKPLLFFVFNFYVWKREIRQNTCQRVTVRVCRMCSLTIECVLLL